jgi:DNA-binding transcriptional LysR family regulator
VDSRELESFITTVENGSISRAAAFLGLSQPAVSKHISKLEEELGTDLLVRGHARSLLTRQGEVVYRYALQVLELQRAVRKEIAETSGEVEGLVRLSASSIPGDFLLPELLVRFRRSYPRVEVEVSVSDTKQALSDLMERRADLAVVGAERNLPGLASSHFFTDELDHLCPREHPFAKRESILQEDLPRQELVGRIDGSGTRHVLEEALRNGVGQFQPLRCVSVIPRIGEGRRCRRRDGGGLLACGSFRRQPRGAFLRTASCARSSSFTAAWLFGR